MIAHMTAAVDLLEVAVFAELAVWSPNPALAALCRTAVEADALDAEDIGRALPGLSAQARVNLLRHIGQQRLIRRDGSPTALGRRCAESGDAPVWEQGVYRLLIARHRLFGSAVLDFERAGTDHRDRDFDSLSPLPDGLKIDPARTFTSVFDDTRRFVVTSLPVVSGQQPMCRWRRLPAAELRWRIDPLEGDNTWQIHGRVGGAGVRPRAFVSSAEGLPAAALGGVISLWDPDWDQRRGWRAMAYDDEPGADLATRFQRQITYPQVEVPGHGAFDAVRVERVPVGPGTADEALEWALALAMHGLGTAPRYLTADQWSAAWSAVIEDTPLHGLAGPAPSLDTIEGADHKPDMRSRWLLRAARDLEVA